MAILKISSNVRNDKVSVSFTVKGEDKEVIEATKILTSSFEKISHNSSKNENSSDQEKNSNDYFMHGMHEATVAYFNNQK